MNKHAYLIMAHNQFDLLKKLIFSLDSDYNDIYVHVDKKAKNLNVNEFRNITNFSNITFIKRKKLRWGDYKLVDAELRLLKNASKNNYSYYHLLSGQDLPIEPLDKIYNFFESTDKEYLSWGNDLSAWDRRFRTYKLFTGMKSKLARRLTKLSDKLQLKLGINRVRKTGLVYLKGDQWFSITDSLCKFILEKEKLIKKTFRRTECPDESVFQTIAYISPYKENMCNNSLRYIDWSKGGSHPKTLTIEDRESIKNSNKLFARKFDEIKSKELISWVFKEKLNT